MNFKVIEGDYSINDKYEEFKEWYLHDFDKTMLDIRKELGISGSRYNKWAKKVRDETGLRRGKRSISNPKYYYQSNGKWIVNRTINNQSIYFKSCKSEEEAQRVVAWLKLHDWDKKSLEELIL